MKKNPNSLNYFLALEGTCDGSVIMQWRDTQRYNMILLSDLHYCAEIDGPYSTRWAYDKYLPGRDASSIGWTRSNIISLFKAIISENLNIDHVIICGDLTTRGIEKEFKKLKELLLQFQNLIKSKSTDRLGEQNYENLDSKLFTIIPGNHDISDGSEKLAKILFNSLKGYIRQRTIEANASKNSKKLNNYLRLFSRYYGETLSRQDESTTHNTLPEFGSYEKQLDGTNICITPLNSCLPIPVTAVAYNAQGEIGDEQLGRFSNLPTTCDGKTPYRIIIMHHSPMPVPKVSPEESFLVLKDSNKVVNALFTSKKCNLVISGHHHHNFIWKNEIMGKNGEKFIIPFICIESTTFSPPKDTLSFHLITLEDRDLSNCSPETTNISVNYCMWKEGKTKTISGPEFLNNPEKINNFKEVLSLSARKFIKSKMSDIIWFQSGKDIKPTDLMPEINYKTKCWIENRGLGPVFYGHTLKEGEVCILKLRDIVGKKSYCMFMGSMCMKGKSVQLCMEIRDNKGQVTESTGFISVKCNRMEIFELHFIARSSNDRARIIFKTEKSGCELVINYFALCRKW